MLQVAFGQSKYYSDNLVQNVNRGIRQKLRRGEWLNLAPFGYVNNPRTRILNRTRRNRELWRVRLRSMPKGRTLMFRWRNFDGFGRGDAKRNATCQSFHQKVADESSISRLRQTSW